MTDEQEVKEREGTAQLTKLAAAADKLPPVAKPAHDVFAREYARTHNQAEAARRAGFSPERNSASRYGSALLKRPEIQARIAFYESMSQISHDEQVGALAFMSRVGMSDFIDIYDDGTWALNLAKVKDQPEKLNCIQELKFDRWGRPVIKLVPQMEIRKQLANYTGLERDPRTADAPAERQAMEYIWEKFMMLYRERGLEAYQEARRQQMENPLVRKYVIALPEVPE